MTRNPYTEEQIGFIKQFGSIMSNEELTLMLNEKFNTEHSAKSVRTRTKQLGIFKTSETRSRIAKNTGYEVGTSKILGGYEYIKVDTGTGNGFYGNWKRKCRLVWEENYGEIPDGCMIVFLNGDTTDCRIENLAMINKSVASRMTNGHGRKLWSEFPEVTKTAIKLCELEENLRRKR